MRQCAFVLESSDVEKYLEKEGQMTYNEENELRVNRQNENHIVSKPWQPTNAHDRFCRGTAFDPFYASDFLRHYCEPTLAKHVDLDNLQNAPTISLTKELKEVIGDASLSSRLLDAKKQSEVLLHLEHKSQPSKMVGVQLLAEAALALLFRWHSHKRSESKTLVLPIPLMVLVYNGKESWNDEMWFQDIYPDLSEELRCFVIQFKTFVANLRRFIYGQLPGKPQTQAIVESMMRATDGTFVEHLPNIMQHVAQSDLDEMHRSALTERISAYGAWGVGATADQIAHAISTTFRRQEALKMIETIQNSFILEGFEIGKVEGKVEEKANSVLKVLDARFHNVPKNVAESVGQMTDQVALDSYIRLAATCTSLDEFVKSFKS